MITTPLNYVQVISLPEAKDRLEGFYLSSIEQGFLTNVLPGVIDQQVPFRGVSIAHKRVVKYAKELNFPFVIIAEDDCRFTDKGAFDYFIKNIPEDYDLYLGGIYNKKGNGGTLDENNRVTDFFCGMTLYVVNARFYDSFLAANELNHIDRELSKQSRDKKFIVCNPFVCVQENGYSYLKKGNYNYDEYLVGRELFKCNDNS